MEDDFRFLSTFQVLSGNFDAGAQGKVYKARVRSRMGPVGPLQEGDVCVVKVIAPILNENRTLEKIRKEAELLEKLDDHENIVRLFAHWNEPPDLLSLAMEFCDLCSLEGLLTDPFFPRDLQHAQVISLHVGRGLEFMHSKGIIHRDLKPSNVVLTADHERGRVVAKIVDFGLATESSADIATSVVGTPFYASPEMTKKMGVTEAADIFAFGIIFSQLLVWSTCMSASKDELMKEFSEVMTKQVRLGEYFAKYNLNCENLLSYVELSCEMASSEASKRPSASKVCLTIIKLCPGVDIFDIPSVSYMKNAEIHKQLARKRQLRMMKRMDSSRLEILTHMTLKNISTTTNELFCALKQTKKLVSLNLAVEFTDHPYDASFDTGDLKLPFLKCFRLHELHREIDGSSSRFRVGMQRNVKRLCSMLFFGQIEQILENKMRIVVKYDDVTLVDIRVNEPNKFELNGGCASPLRIILGYLPFCRISLRDMVNIHDNKEIKWESRLEQCRKLQLDKVSISISRGEMFTTFFPFLTELRFRCRVDVQTRALELELSFLPTTIRKLFLGHVTLNFSSMKASDKSFQKERWQLDAVHFDGCRFPKDFRDTFMESMEVKDFTLTHTGMCPLDEETYGDCEWFVPDLDFLGRFMETEEFWETLTFSDFDWTAGTGDRVERTRRTIENVMKENNIPLGQQFLKFSNVRDGKVGVESYDFLQFDYIHMDSFQVPQDNSSEEEDDFEAEDSIDKVNIVLKPDIELESTDLALCQGIEISAKLDESVEGNFFFESPESGPVQHFKSIPKRSKSALKNIHLRRCIINGSSLATNLIGCRNLETLTLELVTLGEHFSVPILLPQLTRYFFHFEHNCSRSDIQNLFPEATKFRSLFFFRGFCFLKGLWKSNLNVKISKSRCRYMEIDHSTETLTMEFINAAEEVFQEAVGPDDNIKKFNLHTCRFSTKLIPKTITSLNLQYVSGVNFTEVLQNLGNFPCLKNLFYFGDLNSKEKVKIEETAEHTEQLTAVVERRQLQTLHLGGVHVSSLTKFHCHSITLEGNRYFEDFDLHYPVRFGVKNIAIIGNHMHQPFFRTLHSLLTKTDKETTIQSAKFENFKTDRRKVKSPFTLRTIQLINSEDVRKEEQFCKMFLQRHGISTENNQDIHVFRNIYGGWTAQLWNPHSDSSVMHSSIF